jgi:hypothetical protein
MTSDLFDLSTSSNTNPLSTLGRVHWAANRRKSTETGQKNLGLPNKKGTFLFLEFSYMCYTEHNLGLSCLVTIQV